MFNANNKYIPVLNIGDFLWLFFSRGGRREAHGEPALTLVPFTFFNEALLCPNFFRLELRDPDFVGYL
jgi:hypothetical protein